MTMGCHEAGEALAALVSGEIDAAERALLESHLAACPTCSGDATDLPEVLARLSGQEVPDPGPAYWAAFGERVRGRIARSRRRARWVTCLRAAAATVLITDLVLLAHRLGIPSAPQPSGTAEQRASLETAGAEVRSAADEARVADLLRRAAADGTAAREARALLDDMVPGDPLEFDDALAAFSQEEERK